MPANGMLMTLALLTILFGNVVNDVIARPSVKSVVVPLNNGPDDASPTEILMTFSTPMTLHDVGADRNDSANDVCR
jgi:hypothetical protein